MTRLSAFVGVPLEAAVSASFRLSRRDDEALLRAAPMALALAYADLEACSARLDALCNATATAPFPRHVRPEPRERKTAKPAMPATAGGVAGALLAVVRAIFDWTFGALLAAVRGIIFRKAGGAS